MNENMTTSRPNAAMNISIPHNKYTSAHVQCETATEQEASVAVFCPVCN